MKIKINSKESKSSSNNTNGFNKLFEPSRLKQISIPLENSNFIISYIEETKGSISRLLLGASEGKICSIDCNSRLYVLILNYICERGIKIEGNQIIVSKEINDDIRNSDNITIEILKVCSEDFKSVKDEILNKSSGKVELSTLFNEIDYCLSLQDSNNLQLKKKLALNSFTYKKNLDERV